MLEHAKTAAILVLAVVALFLGSKQAGMPGNTGANAVVIIARQDLAPGTAIKEDMLETSTVPRKYVQGAAFEVGSMTDIKFPVGLVPAVRIPKGDQVTRNCLVDSGKKPAPEAKATDKKTVSRDHYLEGLKYFQDGDYAKATAEWKQSVKLDPKNIDAANGLARIKKITGK